MKKKFMPIYDSFVLKVGSPGQKDTTLHRYFIVKDFNR